MGLVFAGVVWWAPNTRDESGEYPLYFYIVIFSTYAVHQVLLSNIVIGTWGNSIL